MKKLSKRNIIIIALAVSVSLCIALYFVYKSKYENLYYQNTTINDIDVSNMTLKEAKAALNKQIDKQTLTITDKNGKSYTYSLTNDLGLTYSLDESLNKIKDESDSMNIYDKLFTEKNFKLDIFQLDEAKTTEIIEASTYYKEGNEDKTTNALSQYDEDQKKFIIQKEYQGTNIVTKDFIESITKVINSNQYTIDLSSGDYYEKPTVLSDSEDLIKEVDSLNQYLGAKITYNMPSTTVTCDISTYYKWLTYDKTNGVSLDESQIKTYVQSLSDKYDTYNKSRNFKTTHSGTITIKGGQLGYLISESEEISKLKENILNKETVSRKPEYSQVELSNNGVGGNYVEVDLSGQYIYCYKNGKLVLSSACVTGNPNKGHATPAGVYHVKYKQSPATLKGQIDPSTGKREYETPVTYWMPFNGGIGFHDATWQSSFGGTRYLTNGSHGCVNLPYSVAQSLYSYISAGYLVICYN